VFLSSTNHLQELVNMWFLVNELGRMFSSCRGSAYAIVTWPTINQR